MHDRLEHVLEFSAGGLPNSIHGILKMFSEAGDRT